MLSKLSKSGASFVSKLIRRSITSESHPAVPVPKPPTARQLVKPFLFTVSVCTSYSVVAIIWDFENRIQLLKSFSDYFKDLQNSTEKVASLCNDTDSRPQEIVAVVFWRNHISVPPIFWSLAILNVAVWLAWKNPRLVPFMSRYFVCQVEPKSIRYLPMVLSNFSHKSSAHLAVNLLFLSVTSLNGVNLFGTEHFLALYLGSGVLASFASYAYRVAFQSVAPSFGATGAILGVLAAIFTMYPQIESGAVYLLLALVPTYRGFSTLNAASFKFFNLAEHFGGTLFGVLYGFKFREMYLMFRIKIIMYWIFWKIIFQALNATLLTFDPPTRSGNK